MRVDPTLRVEERENVWALGDCARVPNEATPDHPDPPTCQHALRQARRLAKNVRGKERPYRYRMLGQVATLGRYKGIADVMGVHLRGFPGWFVTRSYHLFQLPLLSRKLRVVVDWTVALFFRRDIAELSMLGPRVRSGMSELERAVAFDEALREQCAERIVPFRFGRALFNDTFAAVWDLNALRVHEPEGATVEALVAEAERLHGQARQRHRRIVVGDEEAAGHLEPGFRELGWQTEVYLFMAWAGAGRRGAREGVVEEVDAAAQRPLRERIVAAEPWADSEETVRMVLDASLLVARAGRARHFAVRVAGEVVSAADLYSDGRRTAQVEDVATSPEHRGRGYASTVVLHAVAEAERTGHDFVFLIADDRDWPKDFYAGLGFAPLGRKWSFLRPPAPAGRA